jgi:hypothetical protein
MTEFGYNRINFDTRVRDYGGYNRLGRGYDDRGGVVRPVRISDEPRLYHRPEPIPNVRPEVPKRPVENQNLTLKSKVPQVITTWKSRFIKAYMLIIGIIVITIGLFMIDESCGCIRKEDKLLSWALKLYVFLGVIMLVLGLYFNTETKNVYISTSVAFLIISSITLALNSWIMKKVKEMVDSWITGTNNTCKGKKEDNRFLSYTIAGITILSVTVFTSIMLLVWVIYRSTKSVYTIHDLEHINKLVKDTLSYKSEMESFVNKLELSNRHVVNESDAEYLKKLQQVVKDDIKQLDTVSENANKIKECMNKIFTNPDDNKCKSEADKSKSAIDKIIYGHKRVADKVLEARGKYKALR